MMEKICSVSSCTNISTRRDGLCATHSYRKAKGLPLDAPVRKWSREYTPCSVDGCTRAAKALGMCHMHWSRNRRGADLTKPPQKKRRGGRICEVADCDKRAVSYGLCSTHAYQRDSGLEVGKRRALRGASIEEKMEHYSAEPNANGCRLWLGGINASGYPTVAAPPGWSNMAHRVAYVLATGDWPGPHEPIHHICGVKHCVEPTHLQKISSCENTAEMLERKYYQKRIAELEKRIAELEEQLQKMTADSSTTTP